MFRLTIKGIPEIKKLSRNLEAYLPGVTRAALYQEVRSVMDKSLTDEFSPITPMIKPRRRVGEGDQHLREAHFIDPPIKAGSVVSVTFGYRGPYAAKLHKHKRTGKTYGYRPDGRPYPPLEWSRVGQWKFLEKPFMEALPGMGARIGAGIMAGLRKRMPPLTNKGS